MEDTFLRQFVRNVTEGVEEGKYVEPIKDIQPADKEIGSLPEHLRPMCGAIMSAFELKHEGPFLSPAKVQEMQRNGDPDFSLGKEGLRNLRKMCLRLEMMSDWFQGELRLHFGPDAVEDGKVLLVRRGWVVVVANPPVAMYQGEKPA